MARRNKRRLVRRCAHEGCKEYELHEYNSLREYDEAARCYSGKPYHCPRHSLYAINLNRQSPELVTIETTYTAKESQFDNLAGQPFWARNDEKKGSTGYLFGDGWNAYSPDFPIGAKLVVTTQIQVVLPSQADKPGADA